MRTSGFCDQQRPAFLGGHRPGCQTAGLHSSWAPAFAGATLYGNGGWALCLPLADRSTASGSRMPASDAVPDSRPRPQMPRLPLRRGPCLLRVALAR